MGTIIVLSLIGAAAYFLFRHVTERGTNTVRAYLYLRAIDGGASVREANEMAHVDLTSGAHHLSIPEAQKYVKIAYGGKQLPMIEDAQKLGLSLKGAVSRLRTKARASASYQTHTEDATDDGLTGFHAYEAIVIAEVKLLSGKASTGFALDRTNGRYGAA